MSLDPGQSHRALIARDTRLDGLLFVGVESPGIDRRPVCPARTPARGRCLFFARAAAAGPWRAWRAWRAHAAIHL
ncbi:Metal binding domain of Ada [Enhygromyxa salina]|uniref:Metal binding domain of Ada n=1 Tax=Enhygromyxa salina TaxID=215803 RepID=A0A2S9XD06_9BACT|nr:Ada metal-binding domain-containing protein [Enhygromyxa salina]PRP90735.1 Metal binding domain of Ada [Enhygromyxa salina]